MPLARTPPPKQGESTASRKNAREHTFSPSQAYPDEAFKPKPRVAHSPRGGSSEPAAPPSEVRKATTESVSSAPPLPTGTTTRTAATVPVNATAAGSSGENKVQEDLMDVEAPAVAERAPIAVAHPPKRPLPSFQSRPPRARQSMPAPRDSPSPERSPSAKSRLKRARKSFAAGMIPTAIPVDLEPEPEGESEPEPQPQPASVPEAAQEASQKTSSPPVTVTVAVATAPPVSAPTAASEVAPPSTTPNAHVPEARAEPQIPASPATEPPVASARRRQSTTDDQQSRQPEAGPSTRTPGRRLSRAQREHRERTPAEVLSEPAEKIATGDAAFGKEYERLLSTLRTQALDRLSRMTFNQLKECYPTVGENKPDMLRNVWSSTLHEMREQTLTGAMKLIDDYRVAKRLKEFSNMIKEAENWAKEHPGDGRPDAWRPTLDPSIISAGANLELWDDKWAELRDEYRELSADCIVRAQRVQAKRAQLVELDDGVSDSVLELSKANALFKDFPEPRMLDWSESMENRLGRRKD